MYQLIGTARAPEALDKIKVSTAAKKSCPITLPLWNWLDELQRFHVSVSPKLDPSQATFLDFAPTVDVPANVTRDVVLKCFCYLEGSTKLKVTFTNRDTREYVFYEVEVVATAPGIVEVITLEAPVRQSMKKVLTIENPFYSDQHHDEEDNDIVDIVFPDDHSYWTCAKSRDIRVSKLNGSSSSSGRGQSELSFELEYRPLVEHPGEESTVELELKCAQLGLYRYTLKLRATSPGISRVLYFNAPLGGSESQTFRFTNFVAHTSTDYRLGVTQANFFDVQAQVKAVACSSWDGAEVAVVVKFEPDALGEVRDTLTITSVDGGEYKCSLQAKSTPPLPQGPVVFSGTHELAFKNVFREALEFVFSVDNPNFSVNPAVQTIASKTSKPVTIKSVDGGSSSRTTGKLLVTCPKLPDMPPWVFYLEAKL